MPRIHDLQPSFNAGEFSDRLTSRTDFTKFKAGVELMENMIPVAEGGAMRRSGTRYIAEAADSTVMGKLKRFEFSTIQAYIIEMGNSLFRFFKEQVQIMVPATVDTITNGDFPTNTVGWTDSSAGTGSIAWNAGGYMDLIAAGGGNEAEARQSITITDTGVQHVLKIEVIAVSPTYEIDFNLGTSAGGTEISTQILKPGFHCISVTPGASPLHLSLKNNGDNTVGVDNISFIDDNPVEIGSPFLEVDLPSVDGPQSADILFLLSSVLPIYQLSRLSNFDWSLTEAYVEDGPYLDLNATATTMNPAAATGITTVTASSIIGINNDTGFQSSDIGRSIRIDNAASDIDWGWAIITAVTSTTVVDVEVQRDFSATTADIRWNLGAWSATTGYPKTGVFFEGRLYTGNSLTQPQTLWASQSDDFLNFTPDSDPTTEGVFDGTIEDDDSLNATLSADNVNAIRWLAATQAILTIGTSGGEWVPESVGAVITPNDITIRRQTTHGCADVPPVSIGNVTIFLQRAKRKVREFVFVFDSDSFQAIDLTRLSRNISFGGLSKLTFAEEPDSILWTIREDGVVPTMTFRSEEDVVGWARQIIGGSFSTGDSVVESIDQIPGTNGAGQIYDSTSRNEVWMLVKRTINSVTKRYIEVVERDYEEGFDQSDAVYVDSCITYDGAPTDTITGLDHLEGETVKVWGDGAIRPDQTVASGSITLPADVSVAQIGLPFKHKLRTLKLGTGNPAGTTIGRQQRKYGITFAVLNSHTISYGTSDQDLSEFDFRETSDPMDTGVDLFTGEATVEFEDSWDSETRIYLESDDPTPFTLLALAPEYNINALV